MPSSNQAPPRIKKEIKTEWKPGMHCRVQYFGIECEGFILALVSDTACVVRFVGYENPKIVPISSLIQTAGKRKRNEQIEEALGDDGSKAMRVIANNHSHNVEEMDCSDQAQTPALSLQDLPSKDVPSFAQLQNMAAMETPIMPPPPLSMPRQDTESEDQAMSLMLYSWYLSGYYTGFFKGARGQNTQHNFN